MPIATTAAILGAAAIGAGATVAASKSNSNAVKQATTVQQQSTDAQIGFQQQARAENTAALSPFMQRGNAAGDTINALLGLGGSTTVPQVGALSYDPARGYVGGTAINSASGAMADDPSLWGGDYWTNNTAATAAPQPQQAQVTPAQAAANAYEIFKQSTGYTSRLNEGMRAINAGYAAKGTLQSGAAIKSALRYGQDYASNEFGNYLGALSNQQGVGLSGASALAGVSQSYANNMGAISQNGANNTAAAAIAKAQNNGALMTGLAGTAGNAIGALSSYGGGFNYGAANAGANGALSQIPIAQIPVATGGWQSW